jgi:hypothetical protein
MRDVFRKGWIAAPALLALFALSGCSSIQGASRLQDVKSVGIISAVGDTFTFTQSGLTGLDNTPHSFSIEGWGVDEQIVARATSVLGQRFQVQTVTYQRELFSSPERVSSIPGADLVRQDPLKELVRSHVLPQGLDAYVVITKATLKYGTRGVPLSGIGLIRHSALFDSSASVHALYVIRLIDGHTFRTIDRKPAGPVDNSGTVRLTGPSRPFDAAGLAISDPLQNESFKTAVSDLINRSLEATLRDLRLTAP